MTARTNEVTHNCENVWCAEEWLASIVNRHFENVDHIRSELLDQSHLIDRHKVASGLLYHIMGARPLHYENETLDQYDDEKRLLNAKFALYVAVQLIAKWHKEYNRKFSATTSRGIRFLRENAKWLSGASVIPVQLMAQLIYLFEQLCVLEGEYATFSCINDDARTNCNRNRQSSVPEYITPTPNLPIV